MFKIKVSNRQIITVLTVLFLLPAFQLFAGGPTFKQIRSVKLPFTPSIHYYTHTDNFKYFLCSTKSEMLMLDGLTGNILWQINFKKDFKNDKFANQYWNADANVILVYDDDKRKGIAVKYFIDGNTGKILWQSDKYVSDFGKYELADGFRYYYDETTGGVILPTKETVDLVDVKTGKTIWSKPFSLSGREKQFNCYFMDYYDLVRIQTGKDTEEFLTISDGRSVTEIEPYFNKKKYLADRKHAKILDIPDKNMYVLMQGETSKLFLFLGADLPRWKMAFKGYDATTNELLWTSKYNIAYSFDWVTYEPYIDWIYEDGKIFVMHDPNLNAHSGLTVLDPATGNKMWEAYYTTSEIKGGLSNKVVMTPFPAPAPVTVDGRTYVVNKQKNVVSCYNSNTGENIWDSKRYPDAQKIPSLYVVDGVVLMQHGGAENKVVRKTINNGSSTITSYYHEWNSKDKYGIIAYNANTGEEIWDDNDLRKTTKDKIGYVANSTLVDGKLFMASDKNFFILEPKTGNVISKLPVAKEKVGDIWGMTYFAEQNKIILNCKKGVVKICPKQSKIEGTVKTPTIAYYLNPIYRLNADNIFEDYAVFTKGKPKKYKFTQFASIDLNSMQVRGVESADILLDENYTHFSYGGEMFYKADGSKVSFYSVK